MTSTPYCLFVTPFRPYTTGGGSPIRASMALEVLSSLYSVIVVHPELWESREGIFRDDWVRAHSVAFFRIQPDRLKEIRPLVEDFLAGEPDGAKLEVVYAFRQAIAPLAMSCFNAAGSQPRVTILDLDDDECARSAQFAPLHEAAGEAALAAKIRAEIPKMNLFRTISCWQAPTTARPCGYAIRAIRSSTCPTPSGHRNHRRPPASASRDRSSSSAHLTTCPMKTPWPSLPAPFCR